MMFVRRSRYDDLYARYQLALENLAKARTERDTAVSNRRLINGLLAEAQTANRRLDGRNRRLRELLDHHRDKGSLGMLRQHRDRLERALRACARYRAELTTAPSQTPTELVAELHRSEQARGALDEQCRMLQRANEAMAAELRDLREGATA
ncbi:hypothetical protein ACFY78_18790 [Streptomyces olindensis]|uniref:hypothetical protein n=1 Tax=Streptomyces olindensis TaxID=358823 RepID=UPI003685629D